MADIADIAQDLQELAIAQSLADHQMAASRSAGPIPDGYCHNPSCCAELDGQRLFCGAECAREYERFQRK